MVDPIQLTVEVVAGALRDVPVSTELPHTAASPSGGGQPERYVVVTLEGLQDDGFLALANVSLTVWGLSDRDAFGMATAAADALREESLTHPYLSAAQLETLSRDEWTSTGQARYFARVQLTINTDE